MTAPALTLTFRKISEGLSAYGDEYKDVSRDGIDGHRQLYIGRRGKRSSVSCVSFHRDLAEATATRTAYEAAKGKEAIIRNLLDGVQYQVFIHDVICLPPKKIESTEPLISYRVSVQLEVTRTA
jgi:hypothetical protein